VGGVQGLLGNELPLEQLLRPRVIALGLQELRANLAVLRASGRELGAASVTCCRASMSSRRARTAPSLTCMPSSIRTSVTLPVILAETVA